MKDSAIKKNQNTKCQLILSYLGEYLGREALHLPRVTLSEWFKGKSASHWDCTIEDLMARIEIKLRADNHTLEIGCRQFSYQQEELRFPFDNGFYLIFFYRNRKPTGRRKSLVARNGTSVIALSRFVAKNITQAYLIDARLIHGIWKNEGEHPWRKSALSEDHNVVRVKRKVLQEIADDLPGHLLKLGIPAYELPQWLPPGAKRSRRRIVQMSMEECWEPKKPKRPAWMPPEKPRAPYEWKLSFPLFILTDNGFKRRFLKRFNGTVKEIVK